MTFCVLQNTAWLISTVTAPKASSETLNHALESGRYAYHIKKIPEPAVNYLSQE